jgi:rhodanese-related sulfurtransferase
MEMVDRDTARHWLGDLDYIFIDIRSKQEWEASTEKIERARHMDPDQVSKWGKELPKNKKIVLYCGDAKTHCPTVGKNLEKMGHSRIYVLDEGFMAWKYRGFPVVPKELEGWTVPQSEIFK